jgi:glycosyltransferase involved in cell wall biosynthesis
MLQEDFDLVAVGSGDRPPDGIQYWRYSLRSGFTPLADLETLAALTRIFRKLQPDIVHAYDTKPSVLARNAALRAGVPAAVATLPGLGSLYTDRGLRTGAVRWVYERLQRRASHASALTLVQNSSDLHELHRRRIAPTERLQLVPGSGVDLTRFRPAADDPARRAAARARWDLPQSALVFVMIARLVRAKGVLEFARAAQVLRGYHPEAICLLVGAAGQGAGAGDHLGQDDLTRISAHVRWHGPTDDVADVLSASDVCVLPSYYREGMPRVLLEAAAAALPVITTDTPGCRDVVAHGTTGLLVPPRDADALASAMRRLAGDGHIRATMGAAGRERVAELFSVGAVAAQLSEIYWRLADSRTAAR